jgi:hypothetical protein
MLIRNNRVILSDNGTLTDISDKLNDLTGESVVIPFVAAEDAIYVGSNLPFNHRYFSMTVVNDLASNIEVAMWDGDEWKDAVNILDQTRDSATSTKSLAQSGHVSWELSKDDRWARDDNEDMTGSGLETLKHYDLYWARFKWSADWTATTSVLHLGQKFSEDADLAILYPDLNRTEVKDGFLSGKTNWNEQHLQAAEIIFRDLTWLNKEVMISANQIIRWDLFKEASVHKTSRHNNQGRS